MKNKIMPLMISGILISFSALSQTTDNASHPKLDAFRKLKQNSREVKVQDTASTITSNTNAANNITTSAAQPDASQSSSNSGMNNNTVTPDKTTAASSTVTDNKVTSNNANNSANQNQPQQQAQVQPEDKTIYNDTRLGSSTQQYDTYKKNNYGAGAVTTTPK